ncbi:MAG TPA: hypothetical protein DG753_11825 [Clostridium sp.]|nr:hypothetical protein [Clostridium sp.]
MNKLVMLSDIRTEKKESDLSVNINFKDDSSNSVEEYLDFKNKFCKDYFDKDEICDNKLSSNVLDEVINKIFLLNNKKLFIDFVNEIFGDCLGTNCKISHIDNGKSRKVIRGKILKNPSCYINIFVEDEYRSFEYSIQFQTEDYENIAIEITKNNKSAKIVNIINLEEKKRYYRSDDMKDDLLSKDLDSYLIIVNSNMRVPDSYELREDDDNSCDILYRFNILKGWKYDFKDLYENNLYLLFPLKIFDLKKHIVYMKNLKSPNEIIEKEISRFFNEMNKYLNIMKEKNIIEYKDIYEYNIISKQLLRAVYSSAV